MDLLGGGSNEVSSSFSVAICCSQRLNYWNCPNMANLEIAFLHLTIVYVLALSCAAKDTFSECQCDVFAVKENLESEFQDKASEESVRIIYFNLQIGNDSYHPLE